MSQDESAKKIGECPSGRERYWSEIGVEEKIERVRRRIKSLQGYFNGLSDLFNALEDHSHFEGKLMIPFNRRRWTKETGEGGMRGPGKDDVYF